MGMKLLFENGHPRKSVHTTSHPDKIDKNIFPQEICALTARCSWQSQLRCNSQLVANYMGVAGVRTVITLNEMNKK